jgi:hypothetical protein
MKINSINKNLTISTLFLGLALASAGAQAVPQYKITATGVVKSDITYLDGYTGLIAYDSSAWFGKAFTLEMTTGVTNFVGQTSEFDELPGTFEHRWFPANITYNLTIDGAQIFSGMDPSFSQVFTINNITVPSDLGYMPPGVVVGETYDDFLVSASGIGLGCFANCVAVETAIYEYGVIQFEHFWDVAVDGDGAITDANYPDLQNLNFKKGFSHAAFVVGHFSVGSEGMDRALISFNVADVTVTAVPEPETYAMLLAGLGLVGFASRRRKQLVA